MRWLAEGRFTKPYQDKQRQYAIKPAQVPRFFRDVREAREEAISHFLEADGSLAKAIAFLRDGHSTCHRAQLHALQQTQKYMEELNAMRRRVRELEADCEQLRGQLAVEREWRSSVRFVSFQTRTAAFGAYAGGPLLRGDRTS